MRHPERDWVNRGNSLIVVGDRQPAADHALAQLANAALGAFGPEGPAELLGDDPRPFAGTLADLCRAIESGSVQTLVLLGGNPVYDAPADLGLPGLLAKTRVCVHHSSHLDETSAAATWHVPSSHFLESWGDWTASDGTSSIQQPLIAPLYAEQCFRKYSPGAGHPGERPGCRRNGSDATAAKSQGNHRFRALARRTQWHNVAQHSAVEAFSLDRLLRLTRPDIDDRYRGFRALTHFETL